LQTSRHIFQGTGTAAPVDELEPVPGLRVVGRSDDDASISIQVLSEELHRGGGHDPNIQYVVAMCKEYTVGDAGDPRATDTGVSAKDDPLAVLKDGEGGHVSLHNLRHE